MNVAILGFGNLGQTLLKYMQDDLAFSQQFQVKALWNRSHAVFQKANIPSDIRVYKELDELLKNLSEIDLVIESAHPSVLHQYGLEIVKHSALFVSSPTAFANQAFYKNMFKELDQGGYKCYVSLGASIGAWDVIRLDRDGQLKQLHIDMIKHPDSFKISDATALEMLERARVIDEQVVVAEGNIVKMNTLAPQNTNTMSIYALIASKLGFERCSGRIVADRRLEAHIVRCKVETQSGLKLILDRDNPAGHGMVTGSATFNSFLGSVLYHASGISHNGFVFC